MLRYNIFPVCWTDRRPLFLFSGRSLARPRTNYLKQRLVFPRSAYPDEELIASVEIIRLRPEKQLIDLRTLCLNLAGEIVCQGEALVLVSDVSS